MASDTRFFEDYTVYKGKGCLSIKAIAPTWGVNEVKGYLSVEREGVMLLRFAPIAAGQQPQAGRAYDNSNSITFALKAGELGTLLSLEPNKDHEFFHDPNKGREGSGTVFKRLKISSAGPDGGRLLSVSMSVNKTSTTIPVPLTGGELAVVKTLAANMLPTLLGFTQALARPPVIAEPA